MSKTKLGTLALILIIAANLCPVPTRAAYDSSAAASFLKTQNLDEWSVMALAAGNSLSGVSLNFLKDNPGNLPTDIEKRILAIVAASENPETFGTTNLVQKLNTSFNGTEIAGTGAGSLLNDDIFGLLALAASNALPTVRTSLVTLIKANQNIDSGWSYAKKGAASDSNDTAMAIMALLASGESANSQILNEAYNYLDTTKTSTGYSFDAKSGFGPDGASTAWVISALEAGGQSVPDSATDYLQSLQKTNGGFAWQASSSSGSAQITAYAVVALLHKFYPVKISASPTTTTATVKILGASQETIFNDQVTFNYANPTALDTVAEAARLGNFSYVTKNTSLGLYVESIAGIYPSGDKGWLYAVGGIKPSVGAANYKLVGGEKVLWFYGGPTDPVPSDTNSGGGSSASVSLSVNIEAPVEPAPEITLTTSKTSIKLGEKATLTWSTQGATSVTSSSPGNFAQNTLAGSLEVEPLQSTTYTLTVSGSGGSATKSVTITVNSDPSIIFSVDTKSIDFGTLKPGESSTGQLLGLLNSGATRLKITATLKNADPIFEQGIYLANYLWSAYQTEISANSSQTVNLVLKVPSSTKTSGNKTGTLIFWASSL